MERLAIVGLSGLSLVLGWDLFRRGVLNAQNADLKAHGWSIRLQRVGPGVFFAGMVTFQALRWPGCGCFASVGNLSDKGEPKQ